ncbi:MAG: hypothetical protein FWD61_06110 [Phycisphaerales bacterium]|nr:hypothetical protein [Phycisphaerales bacterium]
MLTDPAMADLVARIRALGMNLNKSALKGKGGGPYHDAFQRRLVAMAELFDCQAWRETELLFDDPGLFGKPLAGDADVIWTRKRVPVVVFQIDSAVKPRSFQKLKEAAAAHKVWIYFGRDVWGFRTFLQKNDPNREVVPVIIPPTFIPSFSDDA